MVSCTAMFLPVVVLEISMLRLFRLKKFSRLKVFWIEMYERKDCRELKRSKGLKYL